MTKPEYIYDLDDKPAAYWLLLYGLQWAFMLFPAMVVTAGLCRQAMGFTVAQEVRFLQLTLILSGLFTAVQTLWGHRYPVLEGPSTALLLTYTLLAREGLPVIQGGAAIAGLAVTVLVLLGGVQKIIGFITPNVVGVILILIAITLLPHLLPAMIGVRPAAPGGNPRTFLISISLIVFVTTAAYWLKGIWKTFAIFLGMLVGSLVFMLLGRLDPEPFLSASWFSFPPSLLPAVPRAYWPAMLAFAFAYLAAFVNSVGSLQGVAAITDAQRLPRSLKRGLLVNGLSGICCALAGIVGTVSYSTSPGVLLVNRVATRFAVTYCGIILVFAAFVPKLSSLLALVPPAVVGATLCVALGGQLGAGLSIITSERAIDSRDYFVVGIPIILGTLIAFLPASFLDTLPGGARVLVGNGLIMGICAVLLLEHGLLRQPSSTKAKSI